MYSVLVIYENGMQEYNTDWLTVKSIVLMGVVVEIHCIIQSNLMQLSSF